MEPSLRVLLRGKLGIQGARVVGERSGYLFISLGFSALSSYRQEREGFLPTTRNPATGRKPVQFLDVSEPTGPVHASPPLSNPNSFSSPAALQLAISPAQLLAPQLLPSSDTPFPQMLPL